MIHQKDAIERAALAAAEVSEVGSTVLRGAWPLEHLSILREAIATYSARRLERLQKGSLEPNERMYATHGVGTFGALVGAKLVDHAILGEMFRGSAFHALCQTYFDSDDLYVFPNRLGFRNHDPNLSDRSFIPYHQDSYTQDVRTPQVLNCWMPLDPGAGSVAPGLELIRDRCRPDFPRKDFGLRTENAAYDFITIDRDDIVSEYGDNFLAPEFEVGDGFVFSEHVIHRTYVTPTMTQPRINFEFRVFSANSLANGVQIKDLNPTAYRVT